MKARSKLIGAAVLVLGITFSLFGLAKAATTTVNLGTAGDFAILAGTEVTDLPTSVIMGNVGLSPAAGSFYSGLLPIQISGNMYDVDGTGPVGVMNNPTLLTTAKNDLTTAFNDAAGRTPATTVATELGGTTKTAGIYASNDTTFQISNVGPLVLDAQGDAGAVFIFQMGAEGTGLTVGPGSVVTLVNGAQACNVFWQVDTASIDTTAVFKGNILALNSISVANGANIEGRLLARNGAVTRAVCAANGTTTGTTAPKSLATTGANTGAYLALIMASIVTLAIIIEGRKVYGN